ncbi:hypothetical protein ACKXF4_02060 [Faecalibacterium prausnitzii]|uniref:hypothetical protein n=1 Tax=Faecalibacterium prausnitzii TaxID=853 RepID=UPI003AAA73A8
MKRKLSAALFTIVLLCVCFCGSAFATKKPSIEVITLQVQWGNNCAWNPTFYYRNNTNKAMKYIDFYTTAYNRVGDPVSAFATKKLTVVGPDQPFRVIKNVDAQLNMNRQLSDDSPFKYYTNTDYFVSIGDDDILTPVYCDLHGNFFVVPDTDDSDSCTYLSDDEVQNAMCNRVASFSDIWWKSNVIDHINVDYAVVTYMDGSRETVRNADNGAHRGIRLQNPPFVQQLAQYQAVYNYKDYLKLNPDLAEVFGTNQKALFEHFVTNGMKEGRQGNYQFNLAAYKTNNPDLVAAFGNSNVKYYEHYISNGKAEGRIAS